MAAEITNSNVNTAAAAVDAPYGPFTRVSDVEAFPQPNSEQRIELTTALGDTVYITYEKLQYEAAAIQAAKRAAGFMQVDVLEWIDDVNALDSTLAGLTDPYSYAEYKEAYGDIRALFPQARAFE